jgi:hypothetical protein
MTKETLFEQIDEIFGDWHGGICYIGRERENQVKEILKKAINYNRCSLTLKDRDGLTFKEFKKKYFKKEKRNLYRRKKDRRLYYNDEMLLLWNTKK